MADLTTPNYPVSYEDDSSLLSPVVDRVITTVKAGVSVDALQVTLEEDLEGYQGDPCFMVFEGGEIWQIEAGDLSFPSGDTLVTLSSPAQRGYSNSSIQPHNAGEEVYFTAISHHQISFKEAVIAAQKNGFLLGTEAQKATYESGAVAGEGWLATDGGKVYICFTAGTFTWVNIISHLDLTGTADDDHTDYHTDGRADTWHTGLSKAHIVGGEDHDHRSANEGAAVKRLAGGVDASKPGSPSYSGQIYFSIDIETLYMSFNGTGWDQLSGTPSGAITMYAGACPSGWTRYTELDDGVYPHVNDGGSPGDTGGSATHNHVFTVNREHYHLINGVVATAFSDPGNHTHALAVEEGPAGGTDQLQMVTLQTGTVPTSLAGDHNHTVTLPVLDTNSVGDAAPTTTTEGSEPPYKELVFCEKD